MNSLSLLFEPLPEIYQKGLKIKVNKGANKEIKANDGTTALKIAVKNKNTELVNLLSAKTDSK